MKFITKWLRFVKNILFSKIIIISIIFQSLCKNYNRNLTQIPH